MWIVNISLCLSLSYTYFLQATRADAVPCTPKKFDHDSIVCVCNATSCEAVGRTTELLFTYFNAFVSTRDGLRLDRQLGWWDDHALPNEYVYMVGNKTYQTIQGFGGAITDAAAIAISKLSNATKTKLINSYFEENGIEYTFGHIQMASCDFSERIYSYDDVDGDVSLSQFKLQNEDLAYKIPIIKQALGISKRNISFFGSPWSSPAWMKTNGNMTGEGTIKDGPGGPYSKAWAQYFVKFVKAYTEQGIDIWGLTTQNQPGDDQAGGFLVHRLGWTAEMYRDFIAKDLGPALDGAGLGYLKLIILDDERQFLPYWPGIILNDPMAAKHVSGIALHWYKDSDIPTVAINDTYRDFGDKFFMISIMGSEHDVLNKSNAVQLGNWTRGEEYFNDILIGLQQQLTGWVDWNMALDMTGGPNWNKTLPIVQS